MIRFGYGVWSVVVVVLCVLTTGDAYAGSASLTSLEATRIASEVKRDTRIRSLFSFIKNEADKSLRIGPHPVANLSTEGRLANDPIRIKSKEALQDMSRLDALSATWIVTEEKVYMEKVIEILLSWSRTNQPNGNPINDSNLEPAIRAFDLVQQKMSPSDKRKVVSWLKSIGSAERESTKGRGTNWDAHRLKVIGLIGLATEDSSLTQFALVGFKEHIAVNIMPDGSTIDFHQRDALLYHIYDIKPLLTLAIAFKASREDLYSFKSRTGSSLQKAVEFMIPFIDGHQTHIEFQNSTEPFDAARARSGAQEFVPHAWDRRTALEVLSMASIFDPIKMGMLMQNTTGWLASEVRYKRWPMFVNSVIGELRR